MLPATGVDDGRAPPQPGGAVEIEEAAGAVAAGVLHDEVAVEHERLRLGERGEVAIDVLPAALHHGDLGVEEVVHGAIEDVRVGHEVGVEDQHQLALGGAQAVLQCAGLEPGAIRAVHILDVEIWVAHDELGNLVATDVAGFVGGIVEDLDLEAVARVADGGHGIEQPFGDVHLVEQGKLHRHGGQLRELASLDRLLVAVPVVEEDERRAVEAVDRQGDEDDQVERGQRGGNVHAAHPSAAIVTEL